ncbi:hypothetical protein [Acinetobacter haemolyticus]|nr:hypothetical protein [Acinetobacter haemolyticus]
MDRIYRTLSELYSSSDFRTFQNNFSKDVYEALANSYANSDGEVKIVTDMCNKINGKSYQKFQFHSKKIHGTRSYVEFCNKEKPVTKELADMVIISVATQGKDIVYEKIALIQNKKEDTECNWKIDQDQLYLLHNFPTFKGTKGIFKKNFQDEVIFLNNSQALGNYGLFQNPGEMVFLSALTVFKLQQGDKLSLNDIRKFGNSHLHNNSAFQLPVIDHSFMEEMLYRYFKYFPKYGFPFGSLPFLNSSAISFNIHEFIRNWTLFNIGEVVSVNGSAMDDDLFKFSRLLLREAGLSNNMSLAIDGQEFENNVTVFVAHLSLDD